MKIDFEADNIHIWTQEYLEAVLTHYRAEELLDGKRKLTSERKINKAFKKIAICIKQDFLKAMKQNTKRYIKKQSLDNILLIFEQQNREKVEKFLKAREEGKQKEK